MPSPKILIIDDLPPNIEFLVDLLSSFDVELLRATKGNDAFRLAQQELPSVILMDWIMPASTGTGKEITKQLKSDSVLREIPVIAVTASGSVTEAFEAGCDDYIQRPFRRAELIKALEKHISLTKA